MGSVLEERICLSDVASLSNDLSSPCRVLAYQCDLFRAEGSFFTWQGLGVPNVNCSTHGSIASAESIDFGPQDKSVLVGQ
jgi:hypothetical protein